VRVVIENRLMYPGFLNSVNPKRIRRERLRATFRDSKKIEKNLLTIRKPHLVKATPAQVLRPAWLVATALIRGDHLAAKEARQGRDRRLIPWEGHQRPREPLWVSITRPDLAMPAIAATFRDGAGLGLVSATPPTR
jgi:hypothetical protein